MSAHWCCPVCKHVNSADDGCYSEAGWCQGGVCTLRRARFMRAVGPVLADALQIPEIRMVSPRTVETDEA